MQVRAGDEYIYSDDFIIEKISGFLLLLFYVFQFDTLYLFCHHYQWLWDCFSDLTCWFLKKLVFSFHHREKQNNTLKIVTNHDMFSWYPYKYDEVCSLQHKIYSIYLNLNVYFLKKKIGDGNQRRMYFVMQIFII